MVDAQVDTAGSSGRPSKRKTILTHHHQTPTTLCNHYPFISQAAAFQGLHVSGHETTTTPTDQPVAPLSLSTIIVLKLFSCYLIRTLMLILRVECIVMHYKLHASIVASSRHGVNFESVHYGCHLPWSSMNTVETSRTSI